MKWTAFHLAAQERRADICRVLFAHGANPHLFTDYKFCPFLLAKPLHCRDAHRQTAVEIRQILIEFFARLLMAQCAHNLYQSDMDQRAEDALAASTLSIGSQSEIPEPQTFGRRRFHSETSDFW
jgi:hypothetical protein